MIQYMGEKGLILQWNEVFSIFRLKKREKNKIKKGKEKMKGIVVV